MFRLISTRLGHTTNQGGMLTKLLLAVVQEIVSGNLSEEDQFVVIKTLSR